jgi:polysaccharide deacetylase family protein (PEP-CTERM system associated)
MRLDAEPAPSVRTDASTSATGGVRTDTHLRHAMTVDVEDFFQVQAFANQVARADWDNFPCRVEANTERVLALFSDHAVKATFFTLGWVAQRYPQLIRRIVSEGHELASHGFAHYRVSEQTSDEFRADVSRTKRLLEDCGQVAVKGYRAASFSIGTNTLWALDILASEGYRYSSSIYPIRHDLYGMPDAPRFCFRPGNVGFLEVPLTTIRFSGRNFPASGGGYFRLLPYFVSRRALNRVVTRDHQSCVFYFHPWEIDPEQPRIENAPLRSRMRHYVNLRSMEGKLRRLMRDFSWTRMDHLFLGTAP